MNKQAENETLYADWMTSGLNYVQYWRERGLEDEMTYQSFRCKMWRAQRNVTYTPETWRMGWLEEVGAPLSIESDNAVIIGDVQLPTTDFEFAVLPALIAEKYFRKGRRNLIIAGDLFNMDGFSKYERTVPLPAIEQELEAASELLDVYLKVFDHIYIFMGNHERRLSKVTNAQLQFGRLMKTVTTSPKVKVSTWGHMTIHSSSGVWRVTHGTEYSVNQLSVADALASKYACHVISHHEHHLAQGWDRYKRHVIINNGGLFDQDKMSYSIIDDSKKPIMAQGFTMLRDGFPTVFGKAPYTNWQHWL